MDKKQFDSRKYLRLDRGFEVRLHKPGVHDDFDGITKNICQGGAFIQTEEWNTFQKGDQTLLTFCLPPEFTGQDVSIRLLGAASVRRIDAESRSLGVEFNKALRQFERIELASKDGHVGHS